MVAPVPAGYLSRTDSGSGYSVIPPIVEIQLLGLRVHRDRGRLQEVRMWVGALEATRRLLG